MEKMLVFIKSLVEESAVLAELAGESYDERQSGGFERRFTRLVNNVIEILSYASLDSLLQEAKSIKSGSGYSDQSRAAHMAGIIGSAYDLLGNGFIGSVKFLLHADMFASTLEQAKGLKETGHLIPAAVLGRIVIEDWLRDQAEKSGIEVPEGAKASTVNDSLKKSSVFSVPKWRLIQSLLDVGNAAAHGKISEISEGEVSRLLEFIEVNCT